jgi:type 1 fimbria pilin
MAVKKFGSIDLVAYSYTILFTGRNVYDTTANIHICNRNDTDVRIWVAYIEGNNVADLLPQDHIQFNKLLPANGTTELRGVAVEQNCSIVVMSDNNNVGAIAYGVEEEI